MKAKLWARKKAGCQIRMPFYRKVAVGEIVIDEKKMHACLACQAVLARAGR